MADKKITDLDELSGSSISATDILPIVDDVSGVPITKKVTIDNLENYFYNFLTATGDIMYATSACTPARLAKGSAREMLVMNPTVTGPIWADSPQSVMTTKGDMLWASAGYTLGRLEGAAGDGYSLGYRTGSPVWANAQPLYALSTPITTACYTDDTIAVSSTTITASTTFSGVPANTKSILVAVSAQWSGSSGSYVMNLTPFGSSASCVTVRGVLPNSPSNANGIVPLDSAGRFTVAVTGSGAQKVNISVWGYTY